MSQALELTCCQARKKGYSALREGSRITGNKSAHKVSAPRESSANLAGDNNMRCATAHLPCVGTRENAGETCVAYGIFVDSVVRAENHHEEPNPHAQASRQPCRGHIRISTSLSCTNAVDSSASDNVQPPTLPCLAIVVHVGEPVILVDCPCMFLGLASLRRRHCLATTRTTTSCRAVYVAECAATGNLQALCAASRIPPGMPAENAELNNVTCEDSRQR
jgi:hypothetical protein